MARTRLRGLEIAGIQIGIEVPESCPWYWPDDEIADFACLPRDPEVHVGVRVGEVESEEIAGERYSLGAWTFEVARRGADWLLGLSRGGRREQLACFDGDFRAGEVVLSRNVVGRPAYPYPLQSPLDEWIVLHRVAIRGGLCLNASASADHAGARIDLGASGPNPATSARAASNPTLLGSSTMWIREEMGHLCIHRTPWSDAMDRRLGAVARVVDFSIFEESEDSYREVLDPTEASELLVTHAVVPVCDEGLFELVLRNAKRIAEEARVFRVGRPNEVCAPIAWQSHQLQRGFALPHGVD